MEKFVLTTSTSQRLVCKICVQDSPSSHRWDKNDDRFLVGVARKRFAQTMLKSEQESLQRRVIICYSLVFNVMDWVSRLVTLIEVSCQLV